MQQFGTDNSVNMIFFKKEKEGEIRNWAFNLLNYILIK